MAQRRRSRTDRLGVLVSGIALVGAFALAGPIGSRWIEDDLTPRAEAALIEAGFPADAAQVSFAGREATVRGVGIDIAAAGRVVEGVYGVRWVSLEATDSLEPLVPQVQTILSIVHAQSGTGEWLAVRLEAAVASEAERDALLAAARAAYGEELTAEVRVEPSLGTAGWLAGLIEALPELPALQGTGAESAADGTLRFTGGAENQASADRATALLEGIPGVTAEITVDAETPSDELAAAVAELDGAVLRFGTDRTELSAAARQRVDRIAALLRANPSIRIELRGYVSLPHDGDAAAYSKRRAQAVADRLADQGVDRMRIAVVGRGAADPVASNRSESGRLQNQRVTVTVKES